MSPDHERDHDQDWSKQQQAKSGTKKIRQSFHQNPLSALGFGPDDAQTFGAANRERNGTRFSLASIEAGEDWLERAVLPLAAPDWEVDLLAAQNAQAQLEIWRPSRSRRPARTGSS